jgi:hypothetical protein
MKRADKLYEVRAENYRGDSPVSGNFWVIANSLPDAKVKTNKWLREHNYRKYTITKIVYSGTIDIF